MALGTVAALGMWAVDKVAGGISAAGSADDIKAAKAATWDIYNQKLDLLQDKNKLATEQIGFQFSTGKEKLDIGTSGMLQRQRDQLSKSLSKTGFAVSGEVESAAEADMNKLWTQYRSNQRGLIETKRFAERSQELTKKAAEYALEEERESSLAELEGMPDTFWEGMWA